MVERLGTGSAGRRDVAEPTPRLLLAVTAGSTLVFVSAMGRYGSAWRRS